MAHTESGFRTEFEPGNNSPAARYTHILDLPTDGEVTLRERDGDGHRTTLAVPDWSVFDALARRFAAPEHLDTAESFAATVARLNSADPSVMCVFSRDSAAFHGLCYQSTPDDLLAATWRGFQRALAEAIVATGDAPASVRIDTDHPGRSSLIEGLTQSLPSTPTSGTPAESTRERAVS